MAGLLARAAALISSAAEDVVIDGLVIVRLMFAGVTATSSDGLGAEGDLEERESASERGTAETGSGLSSSE